MAVYEEMQGRVAVVTGGADGIGRDICRALAHAGCRVYFCDIDEDRAQNTAANLGDEVTFIAADVAVPEQIAEFASRVGQETGRVDYLVNNVAVDDRIAFAELTADNCDRMWDVNLRSAILTSRAFLPLIEAGDGKAVVNIGTTNFMLGLSPFTAYNAAKSGLLGFTGRWRAS